MKSRIIITIGDYNGIGPEIILKTLRNRRITQKYNLTVISPPEVLYYYSNKFKYKVYADNFDILPIDTGKVKVQPGKLSSHAGFTAGAAIKTAAELCMQGEYDAVVTAPINKKSLNLGGFNFSGHTEMLTAITEMKDSCMIMLSGVFNIAFATTHPPLKKVASLITKELLVSKFNICRKAVLSDFAKSSGNIGVLGLNPHAGDDGLIGAEENKVITPVIIKAGKNSRVKFKGPFSPDAFFASKKYRNFALTIAMYHDQGLIPFKMLSGHKGTNYTAGLPFVRTSPDHGTAFDIAGKNIADPVSLIEAIKWADKLTRNRKQSS